MIHEWLYRHLTPIADKCPPDRTIRRIEGKPHMLRWYLVRTPLFSVYLHHIIGSDEDKAMHDHPWANLSLVLSGHYIEHQPNRRRMVQAGEVLTRWATTPHRIEVTGPYPSVWSLFICGPRRRVWGFHCPKGWIPWTQFVDPKEYGSVGAGCPD